MSVTVTVDAIVLCFTLVAVLGGGFAIKWWKDNGK